VSRSNSKVFLFAIGHFPAKLENNQIFQVDGAHQPVSNAYSVATGLKTIKIFNFFEFDGARDSVSPS